MTTMQPTGAAGRGRARARGGAHVIGTEGDHDPFARPQDARPGPLPDTEAAGHELELDVEPLPTHEEVAQLRAEREAYLEQLQRERAEFANFRRRTERERTSQRVAVIRDVMQQILPVLDNLERAVSALSRQDPALAGGVDMVRGQLEQVLAGHGLVEVAGGRAPRSIRTSTTPSRRCRRPNIPKGPSSRWSRRATGPRRTSCAPAKVVVATRPPAPDSH